MARLIIIEDDPELQHLLGLTLYKQGYECTYAFNGKEGFEKILAGPPDLILLDLMLPVLSGTEVVKLVMENPALRPIPIIVMTGWSGDADKLERSLRDQGVREYVQKPLIMADLSRLIQRVLRDRPTAPASRARQASKGNVRLDLRLRTVWIDDKLVATLPPQRAGLLKVLLESRGPVTKEKLIEEVWGGSKAELSALEKAIQRLREDLGPSERARIQTSSEGYEFLG
jgi:DNA-binding response OmpR family regulator